MRNYPENLKCKMKKKSVKNKKQKKKILNRHGKTFKAFNETP